MAATLAKRHEVIDFTNEQVVARRRIPRRQPRHKQPLLDGKSLRLSGRYDDVVYRFDTPTGKDDQIKVGLEPHGTTVWPRPGLLTGPHGQLC